MGNGSATSQEYANGGIVGDNDIRQLISQPSFDMYNYGDKVEHKIVETINYFTNKKVVSYLFYRGGEWYYSRNWHKIGMLLENGDIVQLDTKYGTGQNQLAIKGEKIIGYVKKKDVTKLYKRLFEEEKERSPKTFKGVKFSDTAIQVKNIKIQDWLDAQKPRGVVWGMSDSDVNKYANGGGIGGTSDSAEMDAPTLGGTMSSSMFEGDTYSNRFENKLWNEIADGTPHSFKKGGSLFGRKDKKFLFV